MKSTTKGILTVLGSAAALYVIYKLVKREPIFMILPSFEKQREFIWADLVKNTPSLAPLKETYFRTNAYNDKQFVKAWYIAKKRGSSTFTTFGGKKFNTKDGLGV